MSGATVLPRNGYHVIVGGHVGFRNIFFGSNCGVGKLIHEADVLLVKLDNKSDKERRSYRSFAHSVKALAYNQYCNE